MCNIWNYNKLRNETYLLSITKIENLKKIASYFLMFSLSQHNKSMNHEEQEELEEKLNKKKRKRKRRST
jgi:hypothetical protein